MTKFPNSTGMHAYPLDVRIHIRLSDNKKSVFIYIIYTLK